MRPIGIVSAAVLSLVLGTAAPIYAQQEEPQPAARPAPQEHPQEQKPEAKPEQPEPKTAQPEKRPPEQPKQEQREEKAQQKEEKRENQGQKVEERREEKREVKTVRIPEERFHANFGRAHVFRINRPVIVAGVPRFQFGGFWFEIVDPWPVGWAYTDEVYVDYIDGVYYVINPLHPEVRVVVNVVP